MMPPTTGHHPLTDQDLATLYELGQPYDPEHDISVPNTLLRSLLDEVGAHRHSLVGGHLEARSILSLRDGQPYVQLRVAEARCQISLRHAVQFAEHLLKMASAAESEGFLLVFLQDEVGLAPELVLSVLQKFRAQRERPSDVPAH